MRKFLIFYNLIFLLGGNVLFASIHYLHDHHSNEIHEKNANGLLKILDTFPIEYPLQGLHIIFTDFGF